MSGQVRNEFLEAFDSDHEDDSQGYDSEFEDLKKGGRNAKRRKVDSDASDDEDAEPLAKYIREKVSVSQLSVDQSGKESVNTIPDPESEPKTQKQRPSTSVLGGSKPLTKKNLIATERALKRSGVIYLSRIPPFMKPQKLRSLLEPYGTINRIFLTPEDPLSHTRRVRAGGNKKRSFTDGWVEFVDKRDAKKACELLNAHTIGGKKGSYYCDDVWNLMYLRGFKWNALTEQIAAENAERAGRMRAEISKSTKENKEFVQNVERAKMLEGMEEKKAAKRRRDEGEGGGDKQIGGYAAEKVAKTGGERPRQFKQNTVAPAKTIDQPEQVKRVLSKIF